MARQENQIMQIALILCAMVIVVLGVTTFLFWRADDASQKKLAELEKKVSNMDAERALSFAAVQVYKHHLGKSTYSKAELDGQRKIVNASKNVIATTVKEAEADFQKDMANFDENYAGVKNYPNLVQHLKDLVINRNNEKTTARIREQEQLKAHENRVAELNSQVTAEIANRKSIETKMAQLKADHERARREFQNVTDKLQKKFNNEQKESKQAQVAADKTIKDMTGELAKKERTIFTQAKELAECRDDPPVSENYDAIITSVNQRSNRVYINRGRADGLRRQTIFNIFDKGAGNITNAKAKGAIEIVQILDDHMAVGRITKDEISNPILPGDLVYSSVWKAGRSVTFALAGFLDVDGNGKSDRQLVHNLISVNGGTIVAELDEKGVRTGKLSNKVRFLVLGDLPTEKSNAKAVAEYTKISNEANLFGVEKIPLSQLMDYLGYEGEVKTIRLGKFGNAADFSKKKGEVLNKSSGDTFRPRRPPGRGKSGAF